MNTELLLGVLLFAFWWANDLWLRKFRERAVLRLPDETKALVGPAPYFRPKKSASPTPAFTAYVSRSRLSRVLGFAPLFLFLIIGLIRTLTERNML
jgi:hypothetical protein